MADDIQPPSPAARSPGTNSAPLHPAGSLWSWIPSGCSGASHPSPLLLPSPTVPAYPHAGSPPQSPGSCGDCWTSSCRPPRRRRPWLRPPRWTWLGVGACGPRCATSPAGGHAAPQELGRRQTRKVRPWAPPQQGSRHLAAAAAHTRTRAPSAPVVNTSRSVARGGAYGGRESQTLSTVVCRCAKVRLGRPASEIAVCSKSFSLATMALA